MLKLYGCPNTRSMRATWALEEVGVEYEFQTVLLRKGEGRRPSFLRLNPAGKVPLLVDGDLVLSESAAICTYVGDLFPASGLTPAWGTPDRARYNQWVAFAIAELEQPLGTIAKHRFALPEELRVPRVEDAAKWDFGRASRVLEKGLGDCEYIVGDRFTGADILLVHTLAWADSAGVLVEPPTLNAYAQRLLARPALSRARAREAAGEATSAT
jgi:glutathione S-transferase